MSLQEQVKNSLESNTPLKITGSGSKYFLTGGPEGTEITTREHAGVIDYQPEELVIKARAGTPLAEIEVLLQENNQMLPFEPPGFGPQATLGGTIACGLSGPGRPWRGAARDFVLGTTLINGRGEQLKFGGEVIKNVAGYDVSRLMAGSFGTLALILDASIKTQPRPHRELTLVREMNKHSALEFLEDNSTRPLPLSAAAWHDGNLYLRLSGSSKGVQWGQQQLGGDSLDEASGFWQQLKEHQLPFFQAGDNLWRISLPRAAGPVDLPGEELVDWGGAQRWLVSTADPDLISKAAQQAGGHAVPYQGQGDGGPFSTISPVLRSLHHRLKAAFDPQDLFNRGLI